MITAIAIDNEPPSLEILEDYCCRIDQLLLLKTFTNTKHAVEFLKNNSVSLVFLDVEMPGMSGLDFKKQFLADIQIILTTAFSKYAFDGFEINAVDYLLKPYTFERFKKAVDKAVLLLSSHIENPLPHITVRTESSYLNIMLADIMYLEAQDDYVKIVTTQDKKPLMIRIPLKKIAEQLPPAMFVRIHRSFIVSLQKIKSYSTKQVTIGEEILPVSKLYEDEFMKMVSGKTS